LEDSRSPDWAVLEWGHIRDVFVVGFGEGALPRVLESLDKPERSLQRDEWYAEAARRCRAADSRSALLADLKRIRERVGEVVEGRTAEVLWSLGLQDTQRLLWTIGFDARALRSEFYVRDGAGRDGYSMLTGREVTDPGITAQVPPEAGAYAVFQMPLIGVFHTVLRAYLASQSSERQDRLSDGWQKLEEHYGFDASSGLLDHLGNHLVIHTFPRHPLNLSLLSTIWIEHGGNRAAVAGTVDSMMKAWQDRMNAKEGRRGISFRPRLEREQDGLWYLQLGLVGPAIAVDDRWIVISSSPSAVRRNLEHLARVREVSRK
jgi:hypothetical protein